MAGFGSVAPGAANAAIALPPTAAILVGAVFLAWPVAAKVRAIGRGLGKGIFFGPAQASATDVENPTASARRIASAVNRNAVARLDGFTAFLGCESANRWGP
jgi:hypothetical protein